MLSSVSSNANITNNQPSTVVIGAGPVGLATACMLKCLNNNISISVFDKREETTRLNGLIIESDSVREMIKVLDKIVVSVIDPVEKEKIEQLRALFVSWKNNVVKTKEIEIILGLHAEQLGIDVYRGPEYDASNALERIRDNSATFGNSIIENKLKEAQVIIGADGAHSVVRKTIMDDKKCDEETGGYLLEFKFQTDTKTKPRSFWEAAKNYLRDGFVHFEIMGKAKQTDEKTTKSGTLHVVINKNTYDKLRFQLDKGQKGDFQNPWNENELREFSKTDPELQSILKVVQNYRADVRARGGECKETRITAIPLYTYRAEEAVKKQGNKFVVLAGDASSGLVFGRGVNKGFKEAALTAQAVQNFFQDQTNQTSQMPKAFKIYKKRQYSLFKEEKRAIRWKHFGIKIMNFICSHFKQISDALSQQFKASQTKFMANRRMAYDS